MVTLGASLTLSTAMRIAIGAIYRRTIFTGAHVFYASSVINVIEVDAGIALISTVVGARSPCDGYTTFTLTDVDGADVIFKMVSRVTRLALFLAIDITFSQGNSCSRSTGASVDFTNLSV